MNKIICNFQLGAIFQDIYFIEGDNVTSKKITLAALPSILSESNISEIFFKGNSTFAKKIEQKTREQELKQYHKDTKHYYYI